MAHGIENSDNLLSVREMPWHKLGTILDEYPTREEAQRIAHPWEPIEAPVFKKEFSFSPEGDPVEEYVEVPDSKLIERSDNGATLGVVNETMGIITNTELWDVAEAVGSLGDEIQIETAGSLEGGKKVWALLRMNEPLEIVGDPHGGTVAYLAFQNAMNGSGAFRCQALNTRIVCANTSAAADIEASRNGFEFRFRHSSGVKDRIEEAKDAVSMWRLGITEWKQAMEHLVTVRVSADQQTEYIERFQPMPPEHLITNRVRNNVLTARSELQDILNSVTNEDIDRTAYGLFMSSIEWAQHVRKVKGKSERSRMESHFKRHVMGDEALRKSTLSLVKDVALV